MAGKDSTLLPGFVEIMRSVEKSNKDMQGNTTVTDPAGNTMTLLSFDGQFLPPFGEESCRGVKDIEIRDDDIVLSGYPKTGSHWTWEVMSMIQRKQATPSSELKAASFLELVPSAVVANQPSPRLLTTHFVYENLPRQVLEKKTKIVFTVRNPKDTVVSYYNHTLKLKDFFHYSGGFHDWVSLYMDGKVAYGGYCDYHVTWDQTIKDNPEHPILVVSYEDMKEDLASTVRRLAKFMDVSLDEQLVLDIAKAGEFESLKKSYSENKTPNKVMMRKGQVGDWKNWLTVAESELIDEAVKSRLHGTIFGLPRYVI